MAIYNQFVSVNGLDLIVEKDEVVTMTNKTLTSPTINRGLLASVTESWTVSESAISTSAGTTVSVNPYSSNVTGYVFSGSATNTWILNVGHASSTSDPSSITVWLDNNTSITIAVAAYVTSSSAYPTSLTLDGASHTVNWQGGISPSSGNADAWDVYQYTILKTSATGLGGFLVLGSRTKFES
jgi:hypothetical protein